MNRINLVSISSVASIISLILYFIPQSQPEKLSNTTNTDNSQGAVIAQPINSPNTKIEISYNAATQTDQPNYYVRVFNCDDGCRVFVNDKKVAQTGFGDDSGLINIMDKLRPGKNIIRIHVINDAGAITYGYEIIKNGEILFHGTCGAVYKIGCENNRENFPIGIARVISHEIFKS